MNITLLIQSIKQHCFEMKKDRNYFNNRRKKRRKEFLDTLGGKCDSCGAIDGLQFDHIDPKTKKFNISKKIDAPREIIIEELKKCKILCESCHRKKTRDNWEYGRPKAEHGSLWMYKKYKCRCDKCKKTMSDYNKNKRIQLIKEISDLLKIML